MARPVVVDIDIGFNAIIAELQEMGKYSLLIGIQEGTTTKAQSKGSRKQNPGVSVAQYAAYNEFGTKTIPERSFMRSAFDENLSVISRFVSRQIGQVIDQKTSFEQAFKLVGQAVTGMVQTKIRQITFPPNSPKTIAKKGSSKPLIDFGQMIASVRYAVRKQK